MKAIIFLFLTLIAVSSCSFMLKEKYRNAKPMMEHPRYKDSIQRLFPGYSEQRERIFGGQEASLGQFPFKAAIYSWPGVGYAYLCGGSFVRTHWVLTAAHCIFGFTIIDIYGGMVNSQFGPWEYFYPIESYYDVIVHQGFDVSTFRNDVGMLYMRSAPFDLFDNPNIGQMTLPRPGDENFSLVGRWLTIIGYGMINDHTISTVLRYSTAPVITNAACASVFGSYITAGNICISTTHGSSTCNEDAGSPNTYQIRGGETTIVGITSFGAEAGCTLGFPAVFTRVTYFLSWIENTMNARS